MTPRRATPDLTPSIMGRLGYMRVAPTVARRRRVRRLAWRSAVALLMIVAAGAFVRSHERPDAARQRAELTVPEAVEHDLQRQQERLRGAFRRIRTLLPEPTAPAWQPPADLPESIERSGMGPIDDPAWRPENDGRPIA